MKKVKITLLGVLLITLVSCKKAEKIEIERPTDRMVSTLAGTGASTFGDGTGLQASFSNPQKIAIDEAGNIYLADQRNHRIRKITQQGVVTTVAGSGEQGYADGNGISAQFSSPTGIAVDGSGNLYIADSGNNCIRKITSSGVVSTLAGMGGTSNGFMDGTGTDARFNYPYALTLDKSNNIFVADLNNNRIRKVTPAGVVTTYVGNGASYFQDGTLETATMYNPVSLIFDPSGNLYVGQSWFIRKITPQGKVSLFAGNPDDNRGFGYVDGAGIASKFYYVYGLATDQKGNLYAADSDNNVVRKITPDGIVSTHAGSQYLILDANSNRYKDGPAASAYFTRPQGIAVDKEGNIFVTDNDGHRLRKISEVPIPESPDEIARKNWNNPQGWK
ncbi:NHL repeat-containing protein [Pedobacter sp. FW305-3-2-15-E-R2A2]|uniref:NHL repeat-containing protein n=1 Tax=Pedobacter sp. FW305-3-2-15-E-R2A2 TaxID=3140251 RepID=UPI0031409349